MIAKSDRGTILWPQVRNAYCETSADKLHNILVVTALEDADLLLKLRSMVWGGQGGDGTTGGFLLENLDSHNLNTIA